MSAQHVEELSDDEDESSTAFVVAVSEDEHYESDEPLHQRDVAPAYDAATQPLGPPTQAEEPAHAAQAAPAAQLPQLSSFPTEIAPIVDDDDDPFDDTKIFQAALASASSRSQQQQQQQGREHR